MEWEKNEKSDNNKKIPRENIDTDTKSFWERGRRITLKYP